MPDIKILDPSPWPISRITTERIIADLIAVDVFAVTSAFVTMALTIFFNECSTVSALLAYLAKYAIAACSLRIILMSTFALTAEHVDILVVGN